jgi:hypothetical protein
MGEPGLLRGEGADPMTPRSWLDSQGHRRVINPATLLLSVLICFGGCAAVPVLDNFQGVTYTDSEVAIVRSSTCCLTYIMLPDGDSAGRGPLIVYDRSRDGPRNPIKLRPGRYVFTLNATWKTCVVVERGVVEVEAGHRYTVDASGYGCGVFQQHIWLADDSSDEVLVGRRRSR